MAKPKQHYALIAAKWMTASSYVTFVTGAINSIIITHALGPRLYGVYAYLVWMITFAVSVITGGVNLTAIRVISSTIGKDTQNPSTESLAVFAFLRKILHKVLTVAALLLLASTLIPRLYPHDLAAHLLVYILFVLLCAAAKALYMFTVSASKGFMVFETEAISNMLVGTITPALGAGLLLTHQGLPAFMGLFGGAILAQLAVSQWMLRKRGLKALSSRPTEETCQKIAQLFRWNTFLSLTTQLTPKSIDTYLLGYLSLTIAVGQYNLAANLSRAGVDVLIAGFSAILLPYLSRVQAENGMSELREAFTTATCLYQGFGFLIAGAGYFLADFLILFLYGPRFTEAIPAFQVMAIMGGITLPFGAYSAVLIATDNMRLRLSYILGTALISLLCSLLIVPRYGYYGALLSICVAGTLSLVYTIVLCYVTIRLAFPFRHILAQWFCALGPLLILRQLFPHRQTALAAITPTIAYGCAFLLLSVNLGGWRRSDLLRFGRQSPAAAWLLRQIALVGRAEISQSSK